MIEGTITVTGVTTEETQDSDFQTALIETISNITGFSVNQITLIFERRATSVAYELQADGESHATNASRLVTTASNSGTLNVMLKAALSTTSYSGSMPTSCLATATVTSNTSTASSDNQIMGVIIGVGLGVLLVGAVAAYLVHRKKKLEQEGQAVPVWKAVMPAQLEYDWSLVERGTQPISFNKSRIPVHLEFKRLCNRDEDQQSEVSQPSGEGAAAQAALADTKLGGLEEAPADALGAAEQAVADLKGQLEKAERDAKALREQIVPAHEILPPTEVQRQQQVVCFRVTA